MGHGSHQGDGGKRCCMNQASPYADNKSRQTGQSKWSMMTGKIPMKIVLPILVVIIVIISLMQFGKPHVVLMLHTNRSTESSATANSLFAGSNGGVGAGAVLALDNQPKKRPNQQEVPSLNNANDDSNDNLNKAPSFNDDSNENVNNWPDEESINAISETRHKECQPHHKVVFIKTHKTASTTSASIFERYGYSNNLTFALPWATHIFHESKLFNRDMVMSFQDMTKFDMLTNHARFNRKEMEAVVPRAKFVTIVRDPVSQFESAFGYFEMAENLGIPKKPDPLAVFLSNPTQYYHKDFHMKVQSWNGQMFDLGLNHQYCNDSTKVDEHVRKLDNELDLVMLTEYFDESLILLRKLMCWTYKDILYLPKGVRNQKHRYSVSPEIADKIKAWNWADLEMYSHFNDTFWRKVDEYGPDFDSDVRTFRQIQQNMVHMCLNTNKEGNGDYRETKFALKKNVPEICEDLRRTDMQFVRIIRWREVKNKFGLTKLLAMIAGGIVLLILVLTALMVLISKVVQRLCCRAAQNNAVSGVKSKCKYSKLSQESEVL